MREGGEEGELTEDITRVRSDIIRVMSLLLACYVTVFEITAAQPTLEHERVPIHCLLHHCLDTEELDL